jgi:hypothetical protein
MKFFDLMVLAMSTMQFIVPVSSLGLHHDKKEMTRSFIDELKQERVEVPYEIKQDFQLVLDTYKKQGWLPDDFKAEPLLMNKNDKREFKKRGSNPKGNMALVTDQFHPAAVVIVHPDFSKRFTSTERQAVFGHELGHAVLHLNPTIDPQWYVQNALIAKYTIACGGPFALLAACTHLISSKKVSVRAQRTTGALAVVTGLAWGAEFFGKPAFVRFVFGRERIQADYQLPHKATELVCDVLSVKINKRADGMLGVISKWKELHHGKHSPSHPSPETRARVISFAKQLLKT